MKCTKLVGAASAVQMIALAMLMLVPDSSAQVKYKTLYEFGGSGDGAAPYAGLIFDNAGNLYGTTVFGGEYRCGTVFELTPNPDGSWTESVLYSFTGGADGALPFGGLIFDQAGNLYGTAQAGGIGDSGVVFELTPNGDGSWTDRVLYTFGSVGYGRDGTEPYAGLIFDSAGNLYGTTQKSFNNGPGTVFKLTPVSGGSWTESVLYTFCSLADCSDGVEPRAGLIFDQAGNLYGTTFQGGSSNVCDPGPHWTAGCGVVFRLTPKPDGSWTETVLHRFTGGQDGARPQAGLTFDSAGNLYGTTSWGGLDTSICEWETYVMCGVVFELTPKAGGRWTEKVLHHFTGGWDGARPLATVIFDRAGNLYGTTADGGRGDCSYPPHRYRCGLVFKLGPNSRGGWNETALYYFTSSPAAWPYAGLTFDAAGNIYGTTFGGPTGYGAVFEITP